MDLPDLHSNESRSSLTKMVMRLFGLWQISVADQAMLLNRSPNTIRRYQAGGCIGDDKEILDRVGNLLNIHKNLRILYPHNRDLVYKWITAKNQAFRGQAAIEVMKQGFDGILEVRNYLESTLFR